METCLAQIMLYMQLKFFRHFLDSYQHLLPRQSRGSTTFPRELCTLHNPHISGNSLWGGHVGANTVCFPSEKKSSESVQICEYNMQH